MQCLFIYEASFQIVIDLLNSCLLSLHPRSQRADSFRLLPDRSEIEGLSQFLVIVTCGRKLEYESVKLVEI